MKRLNFTKLIFTIAATLLLTACGPSQEEKENIATIACNVMGESRNMDGAFRIEKMNEAREKVGEEPFLGSDDDIKESFRWGLCEELVGNPSEYQELLSSAKRLKLELERGQEEAELIAEKKRKERVADALVEWKQAITDRLESVPLELLDVTFDMHQSEGYPMVLYYQCIGGKSLAIETTILFEGLEVADYDYGLGDCEEGTSFVPIRGSKRVLDWLYDQIGDKKEGSLKSEVMSIDVTVLRTYPSEENQTLAYLHPENFHPELEQGDLEGDPVKIRMYPSQ